MSMYIRNKRRLSTSIVLVATMALSAVAVLGFARTSFGVVGNTVTIGSDTVQPGQSVSVPIDAFVSPDLLGAATIEVDYDPSVIDAVSCTAAAGFDLATCVFDSEHDGAGVDTVRLSAISTGGKTGSVHLADITFKAVGQPGEFSALDVRIEVFADTDGQPITVTDVDGQINIPATPTTTATPIPTSTATAPPTSTATATSTPAPTATATATPTPALATPNSSPTPTPTGTATPFASPSLTSTPNGGTETPTPNAGPTWGDVDCSGAIGPADALKILRSNAGLSVSQEADCPEIGSTMLLN